MKRKTNIKLIGLKDLWQLLLKRIVVMIIVAVIAMGSIFAYVAITFVPQYKSTATLYILKKEDDKNYDYTSSDFSLALDVVNDCTYILKSSAVLEKVIEMLDLEETPLELSEYISTSNPENTRILEVSVVSKAPGISKKIVDALCDIGAKKITSAMGFEQVNLYSYGTLDGTPCNKVGILFYLIIGVCAAAATYFVFLLMFLLDDRIKNQKDVENYLGLSVLGVIPNADDIQKEKNYSYYRKYSYKKKNDDNKKGEVNE